MTDIRNYAVVTAAYWGFTLTDGALRMLVLLHFHTLGYSPLEVAFLFLFYELFGVVTNLVGGWVAARLGLKATLFGGLALQVFALTMLAQLSPDWSRWGSVAFVMAAQALSGIAKDLTKMSSKSAIKLVVPENAESKLFKWVAILTGSKNALKGAGFFLGGLLLATLGFIDALYAMAAALALILASAIFLLPRGMGKSKTKAKFSTVFSKSREINILSAARFFPVWRTRCLVRCRLAGLPIRHAGMELYRGRRLPRIMGHRVRHGAVYRPENHDTARHTRWGFGTELGFPAGRHSGRHHRRTRS